jgi:hypothetical protein
MSSGCNFRGLGGRIARIEYFELEMEEVSGIFRVLGVFGVGRKEFSRRYH